jgi:hypothetical protein
MPDGLQTPTTKNVAEYFMRFEMEVEGAGQVLKNSVFTYDVRLLARRAGIDPR